MPDFTMCTNGSCPSREMCVRATTTPGPHRQSYACFSYPQGSTQCRDFMPNEKAQMWNILSKPVKKSPGVYTVERDINSFYPGILSNVCDGVHPRYLDKYPLDKSKNIL